MKFKSLFYDIKSIMEDLRTEIIIIIECILIGALIITSIMLCDKVITVMESNSDVIEYSLATINTLETKLEHEKNRNKILKDFINSKKQAKVIITAYVPRLKGINSDADPSKTATMDIPISGRTCAISTELVRAGWLGEEIYIEGYGVFIATDRLNTKLKGKRIDLCVGTLKEAKTIGVKENVYACKI